MMLDCFGQSCQSVRIHTVFIYFSPQLQEDNPTCLRNPEFAVMSQAARMFFIQVTQITLGKCAKFSCFHGHSDVSRQKFQNTF